MRIIAKKDASVDPVCQMKIINNRQVPSFTYRSDTYYFCAEACREAFISDPEKYIIAKQVKPAKPKGVWGRYLDRLNKVTGGKPPCCH